MILRPRSDLVSDAAVAAEVPLLQRYPHHGGEDEEGAEDANGVGPDAHEDDLFQEDIFKLGREIQIKLMFLSSPVRRRRAQFRRCRRRCRSSPTRN